MRRYYQADIPSVWTTSSFRRLSPNVPMSIAVSCSSLFVHSALSLVAAAARCASVLAPGRHSLEKCSAKVRTIAGTCKMQGISIQNLICNALYMRMFFVQSLNQQLLCLRIQRIERILLLPYTFRTTILCVLLSLKFRCTRNIVDDVRECIYIGEKNMYLHCLH
jgi:hypothetical protein